MADEFTGLHQLLAHIDKTARDSERVSLEMVVTAVGLRSFAPLLLLVGLILFSPLSGIPGVPTTMALLVLLVTVQLLLGRRHFWLPQWLLRRSISKDKLQKALRWLEKPARFIDRWLRPRLQFLVKRSGTYLIASICTVIALALPFMEIVPFSATIAGLALAAFGLALVAHDGLLALVAFVVTAVVLALIVGALT
ncbi:exopolysaccharide biosynthesis protein [Microbulbifer magnicolonia]|uniref:exopolysaccharide biosynthesis protein n=1 Tax=Microbulbifer magnicolonia TaxID=3109744 RepID=UPI002B40A7A7|nr:exopolysaccharide biosynthesis protein [Microbulbifer sp. GG15]